MSVLTPRALGYFSSKFPKVTKSTRKTAGVGGGVVRGLGMLGFTHSKLWFNSTVKDCQLHKLGLLQEVFILWLK